MSDSLKMIYGNYFRILFITISKVFDAIRYV